MRLVPRAGVVVLTTWALVVGIVLTSASGPVQARPEYKKRFDAKYKEYFDKAGTMATCDVCHVKGMKKTERVEYGESYGKALGEKKVKDNKKIDEALEKIEGEESPVEGKKYIDLIKEGKFPSGNDPS